MASASVEYDQHNDEWWVTIECPGCGRRHGFPEPMRAMAETTAAALSVAPYCLNCIEPTEKE